MKYFIILLLLLQVSQAAVGDMDNDLIPDNVDLCPNTEEGVFVDKFGCRKAIEKVIYFDHGKSFISPDQYIVIKDIIALAKELKGYKIYIQGHADSTSTASVNLAISKQRANNVFKALSKGLDKSRMVLSWFGESEPIASNVTKEGRSENRRVTIRLK